MRSICVLIGLYAFAAVSYGSDLFSGGYKSLIERATKRHTKLNFDDLGVPAQTSTSQKPLAGTHLEANYSGHAEKVPEPTSLGIIALSIGGFGLARRKR